MEKIKTFLKNHLFTMILVAAVIVLLVFKDKILHTAVMEQQATVTMSTVKSDKEIEVWTNLDGRIACVDKKTGVPVLVLSPEIAKTIMVSEIKIYKVEEAGLRK